MKHLLIYITTLMLTISLVAQNDTLSITLSPFTKKQAQSEILYVAVFIKSNIRDSIQIDDSRSWINCINALGVKLVTETLQDDCYKEVDKSDCHPIYNTSGDYFDGVIKSVKLGSFAEYSYIVEVLHVLRVEEKGSKKTVKNFNRYRFKLELPYKHGARSSKVTSKNWVLLFLSTLNLLLPWGPAVVADEYILIAPFAYQHSRKPRPLSFLQKNLSHHTSYTTPLNFLNCWYRNSQ